MGSFNMTCFASQQTIAPGDLCRVLPILQQSSYQDIAIRSDEKEQTTLGFTHSTCYYDSFWQAVGGFIHAKYDDYGRVELELDEQVREHVLTLFGQIHERGWDTDQGENEYHDLAFAFDAFLADKAPGVLAALTDKAAPTNWRDGALDDELTACWGYMWEVGQKQRLFMSDYKGRPRALNFALIHEDAYAELLAQTSAGTDWHGNSNEPEAYLRRVLAEADLGGNDDKRAADAHYFAFALAGQIREALSRADGTGHSVGGATSGIVHGLVRKYCTSAITADELIEQCLPLLEDRYVLAGLNNMNLRLTPVVTSGQDYDNSIGQGYAKFVAAVSAKVTRGRLLHMYGEFASYTMQAASQAHVDALVALIPECDGAIEDVVITPGAEGFLDVQFSCTHDLETLRQIFADEMEEGGELMAKTLQSRAADA
jgi:hypothetical protein